PTLRKCLRVSSNSRASSVQGRSCGSFCLRQEFRGRNSQHSCSFVFTGPNESDCRCEEAKAGMRARKAKPDTRYLSGGVKPTPFSGDAIMSMRNYLRRLREALKSKRSAARRRTCTLQFDCLEDRRVPVVGAFSVPNAVAAGIGWDGV